MATTDKDFYRALNNAEFPGEFRMEPDAPADWIHPLFRPKKYLDDAGMERTRLPDVTFAANPETGQQEVQTGGGTSLFDVPGWFGYDRWKYFHIHQGTNYPENLVITTKGKRKKNRDKTVTGIHYQIEPRNPMTEDALKGALDIFARNAIVRSIQLAKAK